MYGIVISFLGDSNLKKKKKDGWLKEVEGIKGEAKIMIIPKKSNS